MLKEVTGDILLSTAGAIAHGIAPHDNFKQGLALSLREQWPGMYKDFRHYCQTYNPKPGGAWSWKGPNSPVIINLFTQEQAGTRPTIIVPNMQLKALHALRWEAPGQWKELSDVMPLPATVQTITPVTGGGCIQLTNATWWRVTLHE